MSRVRILAAAALIPGAALLAATTDVVAPVMPDPFAVVGARLPGFAAELAEQPVLIGAGAWPKLGEADAWRRLATVSKAGRQRARWDYARGLIGRERGPEALGVLDVMRQDDPDLGMVTAFRLALGAAYTQVNRQADALAALDMSGLAGNPEACLWRLRALAQDGLADQALQQMACAAPALEQRRAKPFLVAAVRAAVEGGQPNKAMYWLTGLPDRDPTANLWRGRALLALGQPDQARLRFARVSRSGSAEERMDARLSEVEGQVARGAIPPDVAIGQLDQIRYRWRGDSIEERALRLSYRLADQRGDVSSALATGAALVRYHPAGQNPELLPSLRQKLMAAIDPASKLPLDKAAGLYWDYRDLAPAGAEGDLMSSRLAERLQRAGFFERAGDLLSYQLFNRAGDLARGPLSARVASLFVLAGRPDRALDTLRRTDDAGLPDPMVEERRRVEAAALTQVGRVDEALAVLQDVPNSGALQAEILWQRHDWSRFAAASAGALPKGRLDAVAQATVLRHAISQAMLGHEDALAGLHARYAAAFKGLPSAPVFEMLTGAPGTADPATLARAMAAIPSASAAGDFADLLERAPAAAPVPASTKGKAAASASAGPVQQPSGA